MASGPEEMPRRAVLPRETGLRALSALLMQVAGASYRPRFQRLEALFDAIAAGRYVARTLSGCRIGKVPKARATFGPATLLISRERPRKIAGAPKSGAEGPMAPEEGVGSKTRDLPANLGASD